MLWYPTSFVGAPAAVVGALVGGDVLVSSVVAKQVDNVQVVPLRRPVQSCPPVDVVLGIGVHSPGEKEGFEL